MIDRLTIRRPFAAYGITLALAACVCLSAYADRAEVRLKDGTTLRGDVDVLADELVIRNAAGEVRYKRSLVDRIERVEAAATIDDDYAWNFKVLRPDDVEGHYALAEYLNSKARWDLLARQAEYVLRIAPDHQNARLLLNQALARLKEAGVAPTSEPSEVDDNDPDGKIAPQPLLSKRDIDRIRLGEYATDGLPEVVQVRFMRQPGQKRVDEVVADELREKPDHDPRWLKTLERGRPHEQLQVVLRATGMKYADQIELKTELHKFEQFRKTVLPLLSKGCARVGCHSGATAEVFRFPKAAKSSDPYIFTTFLLFDRMETRVGPMIDRAAPDQSALLKFLVPAPVNRSHPHPDVKGRFSPPLRGVNDRQYKAVVEWIRSLRTPRPDYELEYDAPPVNLASRKANPEPVAQPGDTNKPTPASLPAAPGQP